MRHTLKSIFSFVLLGLSLNLAAQDSIPKKTERYGIRVGADLSRLARSFYEKDYRGFEIVGDYRLSKKIFIAGEIGNEDLTENEAQLSFTTKGSYFKAGFDFNAYENWLDMENMIYAGMRYGVSSFSQQLNSYAIYNTNPYFGQDILTPNQKFDGLTAHWVEFVAGVKAELFSNLFLGFSVRMNYLVSNKKPEGFDNLYIPGFNRTYEGNFGVGFNYSLSYFIPLYKTAKKTESTQKK
ncbi:DUF6048 family protein [Flavobacterium cerinum]|uniref:DUF6048 family protein n=2 Tax=Flavobacterium cerinum TaxID=2502784 RepID=A0ABY5IYM5_9FLAO|nr:DUF6048 family protein [Flavobacterium cerinum]UUC47405.1 DUF6048 family protein [Flavobacterium cerinum]